VLNVKLKNGMKRLARPLLERGECLPDPRQELFPPAIQEGLVGVHGFTALGWLDPWTKRKRSGLLALVPAVILHEVEKRGLHIIPKAATIGVGVAETASNEE
jgi:hypothetical protein